MPIKTPWPIQISVILLAQREQPLSLRGIKGEIKRYGKFHISHETIRQILKTAGVEKRAVPSGKQKVKPRVSFEQAKMAYLEHKNIRNTAASLGITQRALKEILKKGEDLRKLSGQAKRKYPQLHDREWLRRNLSGRTYKQLRELIGCSMPMLVKAITWFGLQGVSSGLGPIRLDAQEVERRQRAIEESDSLRKAANDLSISPNTLYSWYRRHPDFFNEALRRKISSRNVGAGR